jgi:hypothetical protein
VGLKSSETDTGFKGAKIFAIGDLNNDKMNDIVTVSEDQTSFTCHYFDGELYKFQSSNDSITVPSGYQIT